MERIKASDAISIYKVGQGYPIEDIPQSPVFKSTTKRKSLTNKTTSKNAMPPTSQVGGNWQQILDRYKDLLN